MLTLFDLETEAFRFLQENYGMGLTIPIEIDESFSHEEGAYEFTKKEPRGIYLAGFLLEFGTDEVVYDVLRHELVHYALHRLNKPFEDGHPVFEAELKRLGIGSTQSSKVGRYHIYSCDKCGDEIPYYRKLKENEMEKAITACCDADFKFTGKQAVYNGRERLY